MEEIGSGRSVFSAAAHAQRAADYLASLIAFMTEGDDLALIDHGISSIEAMIRKAQGQFNRWLDLPADERRPSRLMDMLGFDYFKLLDMLTIVQSRKHMLVADDVGNAVCGEAASVHSASSK